MLNDTGVFVFAGGGPRTKTKDSDPVLQFILSYRKIYGLAAFMGLADRDRFELSGDDLDKWLKFDDLAAAKEVLLRNQINEEVTAGTAGGGGTAETEASVEPEAGQTAVVDIQPAPGQGELFGPQPAEPAGEVKKVRGKTSKAKVVVVREADLSSIPIETVFTGLGFEDRTLASNRLLAGNLKPKRVQAVKYEMVGHAKEILDLWRATGTEVIETDYKQAVVKMPSGEGLCLIDVSGLAKPIIFKAVRGELMPT